MINSLFGKFKRKMYIALGAIVVIILGMTLIDFGGSIGLGSTVDKFDDLYGKPVEIREISFNGKTISEVKSIVYKVNNGSELYAIMLHADKKTNLVFAIATSGTKDTITRHIPSDAKLCIINGKSYGEDDFTGRTDFYSSNSLRKKFNEVYGSVSDVKYEGERDLMITTVSPKGPFYQNAKFTATWSRASAANRIK